MNHVWNRLSEGILHRNCVFSSGGSVWTGWFSRGSDVSSRILLCRRQLDRETSPRVFISDCCCCQQQTHRVEMIWIFSTAIGDQSLIALGEIIKVTDLLKPKIGIVSSITLLWAVWIMWNMRPYEEHRWWLLVLQMQNLHLFYLLFWFLQRTFLTLWKTLKAVKRGIESLMLFCYYKHDTWTCWTAVKYWNHVIKIISMFILFVPFYTVYMTTFVTLILLKSFFFFLYYSYWMFTLRNWGCRIWFYFVF